MLTVPLNYNVFHHTYTLSDFFFAKWNLIVSNIKCVAIGNWSIKFSKMCAAASNYTILFK